METQVTDEKTRTRDWVALEKDIQTIGKADAAVKHGYLSIESMMASVRNHNASASREVNRGRNSSPTIESITQRPQFEENEDGEKEIPQEIQDQLLSTEMLALDVLLVDPQYQREIDSARINKMIREWSWLGCGTLAVNLRTENGNSVYAVIDGQQRMTAIKRMGYRNAPCRVYLELTRDQEALLFETLNNNKKPNYNDLFKSRLSRNEQIASAIRAATESCGYHLDPDRRHTAPGKTGHYYIQTMRELERIQRVGGAMLIIETLKFLKATWPDETLGNQQMVLAGISTFIHTYKSGWTKTELIAKLQRLGIDKMTQRAFAWLAARSKGQGGNTRGIGFCEAMLMAYNDNRRIENRLKSKHNF